MQNGKYKSSKRYLATPPTRSLKKCRPVLSTALLHSFTHTRTTEAKGAASLGISQRNFLRVKNGEVPFPFDRVMGLPKRTYRAFVHCYLELERKAGWL